tara:strand:- start:150 stop:512 length:363 start_codon:yes stop_codon:yes gene_type:complete
MGVKKDWDTININDWKEVADFARASGVTAKELYDYTIKNKQTNKTTIEVMQIGCLVYDALKKKSKLSKRSRIINLRKSIEYINPKYKMFSDQQLYENTNHALNRTPDFIKWDKKVRKQIF